MHLNGVFQFNITALNYMDSATGTFITLFTSSGAPPFTITSEPCFRPTNATFCLCNAKP